MESEVSAIEFANHLPTVTEGRLTYSVAENLNSNFNPEWIRGICESKGWTLQY